MGLNDTPSADRVHIGFFGRRNAGKSSIVNAVTGQDLAVVSDVKGTTTDPVSKAMRQPISAWRWKISKAAATHLSAG